MRTGKRGKNQGARGFTELGPSKVGTLEGEINVRNDQVWGWRCVFWLVVVKIIVVRMVTRVAVCTLGDQDRSVLVVT